MSGVVSLVRSDGDVILGTMLRVKGGWAKMPTATSIEQNFGV